MPQVGELKHTIAIKSATPSRSATGGESQAWTTTVATCRAKIEPLRGEESLSAGIQDASVTHRVWIWYRSGITTKHRISGRESLKFCRRRTSAKNLNGWRS